MPQLQFEFFYVILIKIRIGIGMSYFFQEIFKIIHLMFFTELIEKLRYESQIETNEEARYIII